LDGRCKGGGFGRGVWFVWEEVEGSEDAVDEEFIGGEKVRLRERRVSEHPELEFW